MKKVFTLLLALVLALGLCSTAWAAETVSYYDPVSKMTKTCTDAEKLVSHSSGKTVKLTDDKCYVVEGDVTITGKIAIQGNVTLILADGAKLTVTGIRASGDDPGVPHLTIYGQSGNTGKLIVNGYTSGGTGRGIYLSNNRDEGSLTINGGDITVTGEDATANDANATAVLAHELTINGGKLTATGGSASWGSTAINVFGKYAYDEVDSELFETDGLGKFTMTGGTVVAKAGASVVSYGIAVSGTATISGGTITATGLNYDGSDEYDATSAGFYALGLTVSGGTLNATGGSVTSRGDGAGGGNCGVLVTEYQTVGDDDDTWRGGKLVVSGGRINATAGAVSGSSSAWSYGVNAYGGINISNGVVTATGGAVNGSDGAYSYGMITYGSINVSGGTVTATSGTARSGAEAWSSGILADGVGGLTVTGGEINATGSTATSNGKRFIDAEGKIAYGAAWSYGVYSSGKTAVSGGGKITGTSGVATCNGEDAGCVAWSGGVYSHEVFTVSGGSTVTGTSGGANGCGVVEENNVCSFGVYGEVDITVSGSGKITGTSGKATGRGSEVYSQGVYSDKGEIKDDTGNAVTSTDGEKVINRRTYKKVTGSSASGLTGTVIGATDYTSGVTGLTFKSSASFANFQGVQVDGKTIDKSNYIAEEGSIEVYLKAVYLQTLSAGKHTVTILSSEGNVTMDFTVGGVATSPKTFDAGVAVYVTMALTSVLGTAAVVRKKKEF